MKVKEIVVYVWSAVDIDSGELLILEASYGRSSLPRHRVPEEGPREMPEQAIVDRGPWYRWALERLGLEYEHRRFCIRNRFFRYLKERTIVFHNKISAGNHQQGIKILNQFQNLFTIYHHAVRSGGGQGCLSGHH